MTPCRTSENNYASMAELARAHGIRVIFFLRDRRSITTTPRALSIAFRATIPRRKFSELNGWLKDYCAKKNGDTYLDYFARYGRCKMDC